MKLNSDDISTPCYFIRITTSITKINQPHEQVTFKIKNNKKWTAKAMQQTVSVDIDPVENDINALITQPTKKP